MEDDRRVFETGACLVDRVELAPDPNHSINWFVTTKIPLYSTKGRIIGLACMARSMADAREKLYPYMEMNEVLEYIRAHYARPVRIEDLARILHVSPGQFERRFKKIFRITPTRHILNVRLRAACNLLSGTNDTIASVALETGFYDHSHFVRAFKKAMGCSPSVFRSQGRRNPW